MTDVTTVRVGPAETVVAVTEVEQTVVRTVPATEVITTGQIGPVGPTGDVGPEGPQGPQGTGTGYEHLQSTPSAVWTVQHNLGYRPGGITVLDADDELVLGWTALHASSDVLLLTYPSAQSGTAYIS